MSSVVIESYRAGDGAERVLLIHGSGSTSKPFLRLGELIVEAYQDCEVIAVSLAGYGSQAIDMTAPTIEQHMSVIQHVMTEAVGESGHSKWHLVGHSLGGFIALQTALKMPEPIASLSLIEPIAFGVLDAEEDREAIEEDRSVIRKFASGLEDGSGVGHFIEAWNQSPWDEMPQFVRDILVSQAAQIYAEVVAGSNDKTPLSAYETLPMPILLLGGQKTLLPARRIVERLAGLDQVLGVCWIENAAHMEVVQRPDAFAPAIAAHIEYAALES